MIAPELAGFVLRWIAGTLLVTAGVRKLAEGQRTFAEVLERYEVVPHRVVGMTARVLPLLECVVGVLLFARWQPQAVSVVACVLYVGFAYAIAVNLARGRRELSCGCFGATRREKPLRWSSVARNLCFAIALGVGPAGPAGAVLQESSVTLTLGAAALLAMGVSVAVLTVALARTLRLNGRSMERARRS